MVEGLSGGVRLQGFMARLLALLRHTAIKPDTMLHTLANKAGCEH